MPRRPYTFCVYARNLLKRPAIIVVMNSGDSENTKWTADRDQSNDSVFFTVCAEEGISEVQAPSYLGVSPRHLLCLPPH